MKAEILNGHLHIIPETEEELSELFGFYDAGINERMGTMTQKERAGIKLDPPEVLFFQITKKGTPLSPSKVKGDK